MKEAYRKKEAGMTGSGPYTEVTFKPWELTVNDVHLLHTNNDNALN